MNTITCPARTRVSEWIITTLARAITASGRGLLIAGISLGDVGATLWNEAAVGHPDLAVQRLLVFQILERCAVTRTALQQALSDIEPTVIDEALRALESQDVILIEGERITTTICTRYLNDLGLISL